MREACTDYTQDRTLVSRCVAGEASAWATLLAVHGDTLYYTIRNTFRRHGGDPPEDLVGDLQAEVLLRLLRGGAERLNQYQGRCSLKHWLRIVSRNLTIDYLRRSRPLLCLDDPVHAQLRDDLPDPSPGPEAALAQRQARLLMEDLGRQLNPSDQQFLALFYEQGLSHIEIARLMNTSVGAIYSRKNRVQQKLSALLSRRRVRSTLRTRPIGKTRWRMDGEPEPSPSL